ncbi:sperm-associated antigen 4 protein-like [Perca flavescens]|uniref:sperm-associated antigen 4 protein-like n=1 Tax=Perca flavescens TaxID=8167 RepID=UPI00106EE369|nr:sperm-associated antigen 4 protein-like [Perca flavescens]XP_028437233.1 sperm-associated antigen 4 protein-like [Perca flavescens]
MPSKVASRKSSRLNSTGYYNVEGEPFICYKETTRKIFRRHRRNTSQLSTSHRAEKQKNRNTDSDILTNRNSNILSIQNTNSRASTVFKIFGILFFLVPLCFGLAYLIPTLNSSFLDCGPSESPVSTYVTNTTKAASCEELAKQIRKLQDKQLRLENYLLPVADTLPNYALESQGACVISHLSSTTYHAQAGWSFLWIPMWLKSANPGTVIKGGSPLVIGHCWPFAGERGHLFITLSHPVTISHVSLSHFSRNLSPTGTITSAPKEFSVCGMKTFDEEGTPLGTFLYDQDGESSQTFKLPDHKKGVFHHVKLQVETNWGNPDYTCLYSFKVHGMLADEGHKGADRTPTSGCRDR